MKHAKHLPWLVVLGLAASPVPADAAPPDRIETLRRIAKWYYGRTANALAVVWADYGELDFVSHRRLPPERQWGPDTHLTVLEMRLHLEEVISGDLPELPGAVLHVERHSTGPEDGSWNFWKPSLSPPRRCAWIVKRRLKSGRYLVGRLSPNCGRDVVDAYLAARDRFDTTTRFAGLPPPSPLSGDTSLTIGFRAGRMTASTNVSAIRAGIPPLLAQFEYAGGADPAGRAYVAYRYRFDVEILDERGRPVPRLPPPPRRTCSIGPKLRGGVGVMALGPGEVFRTQVGRVLDDYVLHPGRYRLRLRYREYRPHPPTKGYRGGRMWAVNEAGGPLTWETSGWIEETVSNWVHLEIVESTREREFAIGCPGRGQSISISNGASRPRTAGVSNLAPAT